MEKDKFIDPKSDYGFKLLFGTVANKELTIGFLNSLLEKNIKDITFHNVEMSSVSWTLSWTQTILRSTVGI